MSLTDYLANKYLNADNPSKQKKAKKRKLKADDGSLTVDDSNLTGWESLKRGDDEDSYRPPMHSSTTGQKSKAKWKVIGVAAPSNSEQAEADAIIAAAAEESRQKYAEAEDAPVIEDIEGVGESRGLVGLRTGDEVAAHLDKRRRKEVQEYEGDETARKGGQETIYRDASGRVINLAKQRAEAQRKAEEAERKKKAEAEAAKGDTQRRMKEERSLELREAKYLTVARHADDVEMNEGLMDRERWNDPALGFLDTEKKDGKGKGKSSTESASGRPLYKGSFEPNRYGIRPGYRWDGVDRGTGFERKWFAARNRQKDQENLEYSWQMDE